jgi:hypothetical protein
MYGKEKRGSVNVFLSSDVLDVHIGPHLGVYLFLVVRFLFPLCPAAMP